MNQAPTQETDLEGVLVPTGWDSGGEVSEMGLMTFDEAEYRIDRAAARDSGLSVHLHRRIRVRGRVRDGRLIAVTKVEVFEPKHDEGSGSDHA